MSDILAEKIHGVTTNNVPRPIVEAHELTPDEREWFDYLDWAAIDGGRDSASFVRFRDRLYGIHEFVHLDPRGELGASGWHGCHADSAFGGIVIKFVNDGDDVVVGTVYS